MKIPVLPIMAAAVFAVALMGTVPGASAQQQAQMSVEDRHFLMHAVPAGIAEVEISRIAAEKAQNQQVKQFAQRMVDDHTRVNDQLMQLAQQKGLQPPQQPGAAHQAEMEHLRQLSGEQFDQQYMGGQIIDHDMAIYMYERETRQGQDQEIKDLASQTLPTLQEHHDLALEITGQGLTAEQP